MSTGFKPAPKTGEQPILFQKFFKSGKDRTYVSQVKRASNGSPYLVLTEGKRAKDSDEVRKSWLFVFSEDFAEFFRMLQETDHWIKANPTADQPRQKPPRPTATNARAADRGRASPAGRTTAAAM